MKRTLLVFAFGLLAGSLAHFGWHAARDTTSSDSLEVQLQWMRSYLELDAEQYQKIRAVHEVMTPQLIEFAHELNEMKVQLAAYEEQRVETEEIDFLAFARFVAEQRSIDKACEESTRRLIQYSVAEMTPEQREQYLSMLTPALESSETRTFH